MEDTQIEPDRDDQSVHPGGDSARTLVDRARHGDAAAWHTLYRLAYPGLFTYARRRLDAEDARDAVSETMTRAVASIDSFEWRAVSFDGWLFGILRHVVLDAQRAACRLARQRDKLGQIRPTNPATPDEDLISATEVDAVRAAFARLAPADRELLELRLTAGLSSEDVASLLGKRAGAVRVAQSRALERLRQLVKKDGWDT